MRLNKEPDPLARARSETKILHDVCDQMISDLVIQDEAERLHLSVSPAEIDQGIASVAETNKVTVARIMEMVRDQGYDERSYREEVRLQLVRRKVLWFKNPTLDPNKADEAVKTIARELRAHIYVDIRLAS